jgi:hypothetical protein
VIAARDDFEFWTYIYGTTTFVEISKKEEGGKKITSTGNSLHQVLAGCDDDWGWVLEEKNVHINGRKWEEAQLKLRNFLHTGAEGKAVNPVRREGKKERTSIEKWT